MAGLKHWALVGVLLAPISACTATKAETLPELLPDPDKSLVAAPAASERDSERVDTAGTADTPATAPTYWPWSDDPAQKPPPVKPYRLPTFSGESRLKLAGMCDPLNAKPINAWLKTVSKVPLRDPQPAAQAQAKPE